MMCLFFYVNSDTSGRQKAHYFTSSVANPGFHVGGGALFGENERIASRWEGAQAAPPGSANEVTLNVVKI